MLMKILHSFLNRSIIIIMDGSYYGNSTDPVVVSSRQKDSWLWHLTILLEENKHRVKQLNPPLHGMMILPFKKKNILL